MRAFFAGELTVFAVNSFVSLQCGFSSQLREAHAQPTVSMPSSPVSCCSLPLFDRASVAWT